jgi:hypothetical protein
MPHATHHGSWLEKLRTIPRRWLVVGAVVGVVLLIAYAIAFLIDEPLRRYTEAKMNRALQAIPSTSRSSTSIPWASRST